MLMNKVSTKFLCPKEAAVYMGKSIETLARYRKRGIGPKFGRTETGRIYYRVSDIDMYFEERLSPDHMVSAEGVRRMR